jgi:hypothetical protein
MDLNVKLQGLKHNFRKVQSVFVKIEGPDHFLEFLNYFSIANFVDWVHGPMDLVYQFTLTTLNTSHRLGD